MMKRMTKKQREECEHSYRECEDRDRCSVICKGGASKHPECASFLACGLDGLNCNGNCEIHRLNKECHDKKVLLKSIGNALTEMNFTHRIVKEEIESIENRIKSLGGHVAYRE